MKDIIIREATPQDSARIAEAIIMAIGDQLAESLANGHDLQSVTDVFTLLAERDDSQYSYRNSMIAETADGAVAGVVVAYDGSILIEARRLFFALAKEKLGWDICDIVADGEPEVETDPSEYYLDSLAVWPAFRGKGIATKLINEAGLRARKAHKPLGLLCAPHNDNAKRLYLNLGFKEIGKRPFAGEEMAHLQLP